MSAEQEEIHRLNGIINLLSNDLSRLNNESSYIFKCDKCFKVYYVLEGSLYFKEYICSCAVSMCGSCYDEHHCK